MSAEAPTPAGGSIEDLSELAAEVQMHAVRLMRSGRYSTGKQVVDQVHADFADSNRAQVDRAIAELAGRLHERTD